MESVFERNYTVTDMAADCFGRLKPSAVLFLAQEVAGMHCNQLSLGYDELLNKGLFWAVTRHRVQIIRLPRLGETIRLETWPMPTTRVAYPRSVVAYDAQGNECFRSISLWVLMDLQTRSMILPGKSGVSVLGQLRGGELPSPPGLIAKPLASSETRTVRFTDLDRNGHMNNTRCMEWIQDLLPSPFHRDRSIREFTVCYLSEAREGQTLQLHWELSPEDVLQVDAYREEGEHRSRVFSARIQYG